MKKLTPISSKQLLKLTIDSLEDDKGIDIIKIDLIGRSSIADYMIVVSGNTVRQVTAMANNLVKKYPNINLNIILPRVFKDNVEKIRQFKALEEKGEQTVSKKIALDEKLADAGAFGVAEGKHVKSFPLRLIYSPLNHDGEFPIKVGFSVPKRNVKLAVDRNRIKRLMREVYRKNKHLFLDNCAFFSLFFERTETLRF